LNAIPEPVAVTNPPHHTNGNVAHANSQAHRLGQGELDDRSDGDINSSEKERHAKEQRKLIQARESRE
jgi:hypothetical protein